MSRIRTVFLGSPLFAAQILAGLLADEHLTIVGVVTQPDRPRGRGQKYLPTPVKQIAEQHSIPCLSPEKINTDAALEAIKAWQAEVAIVVAYGQILSQKFLELFHFGAMNIHASLLPKWRGAAPIQRAIEAGEQVMGVSLQKIVKELDAGDIIGQRHWLIDENTNALQVLDQCLRPSLHLLQVDLMDYIRGHLASRPQDHTQATYAPKISKEEGYINFAQSAWVIHNKIRAFIMGPGCYCFTPTKERLKLLKTQLVPVTELTVNFPQVAPLGMAWVQHSRVFVSTFLPEKTTENLMGKNPAPWASGWLELVTVQPENKSAMPASQWIKGLNHSSIILN